jgi:hypothetical protein
MSMSNRAAEMARYAIAWAFGLVLVAVAAGFTAGERQLQGSEYSFSEDPPFDWVLAALVAGPFLVGAFVMLGVSIICQAFSRPDAP